MRPTAVIFPHRSERYLGSIQVAKPPAMNAAIRARLGRSIPPNNASNTAMQAEYAPKLSGRELLNAATRRKVGR